MTYSTYTKTGPFTNGGAPGISAAFLNAAETFMAAGWFDSLITSDHSGNLTTVSVSNSVGQIRGLYLLNTPFQMMNNPTVNAGSTSAFTGAGGSTGVPTSATAILISAEIICATNGAYVIAAPHGATIPPGANGSGYMALGTIQVSTSQSIKGMLISGLSSNQIDVKSFTGNCVLQYWSIVGYFA